MTFTRTLYRRIQSTVNSLFTQSLRFSNCFCDRSKLFWNYFWILFSKIIILQVFTSRLIPEFSKNSNQNLFFRVCKISRFRKMNFWPWKRPKPVKLEWKFMTLAIFCWIGLVQASTRAEKNMEKFRINLYWFESNYMFSLDLIFFSICFENI